jgi:hypothetical protein
MTTATDKRITTLRELSINRLAGDAGCSDPDSGNNEPMSDGARLLNQVRDGVIEAIEYAPDARDYDDQISEIADSAPDVYTHRLWSEFVDLGAYNEDPTELGFDGSDMEQGARVCLYIIADRLARSLFDMVADQSDDEEEA